MRYSPRPEPGRSPDRRSAGRLDARSSLTRGKLRACVQLGARWQPLSTPPTLWAWVGVGMGWGAGAMFGYDSLWPYKVQRARSAMRATDHHGRLLGRSPIRGSSRISGARCVECAAARSAETARRAASRGAEWPSVGPWPHLRRRNRGASGRARIAATDHHGRLLGRSAALAESLARTASNAPRRALL